MRIHGSFRDTSCCGLHEFHNLWAGEGWGRQPLKKSTFRRGKAYFATTISNQLVAIKELKAAGFKEVGSWRNSNTGRRVTLWVKNITKRRKK